MRVPPIASFEPIRLDTANEKLEQWGHKMGRLHRGNQDATCHGLFSGFDLVAVTCVSTLIAPNVGGGMSNLTRDNCIELSRLCAARSGLCRVAIRLWREFVFPALGYQFAISYHDADIHNGNTYRFDGWSRVAYARSGTDTRSGRSGRNKWVWLWPAKDKEHAGTFYTAKRPEDLQMTINPEYKLQHSDDGGETWTDVEAGS